jgi:hypothetical protein
MKIEKDGKIFNVTEQAKSWTVSLVDSGNFDASAKITKADCPTFEDLKAFIAENDLF